MKHKIFCFNNGGPENFLTAIALGDDGQLAASHICSDESFMRGDLGIVGECKHEIYNRIYGAGNWELEWVPRPREHAGLAAATELHVKLKTEPTT